MLLVRSLSQQYDIFLGRETLLLQVGIVAQEYSYLAFVSRIYNCFVLLLLLLLLLPQVLQEPPSYYNQNNWDNEHIY
jgi:hypothetical protein